MGRPARHHPRLPPPPAPRRRQPTTSSGSSPTKASSPPPSPHRAAADLGDSASTALLRTALRVGFTAGAGPFRSLAGISVSPRSYQYVPLLMALRQDTVRLLIADDVGIGKTIEAGLIAAELLAQGTVRRLAVLCSPALAEQWQRELASKFGIDAALVLTSTVKCLERGLMLNESLFDRYPHVIVSTDFIKSDRRRHDFLLRCPELVIVDEAHNCVAGSGVGQRSRHQRFELLRDLAADPNRHLVLATATPHSGDDAAFANLIGLLQRRPRHGRPQPPTAAAGSSPSTSSNAAGPTSATTSTRTPPSPRTASPSTSPTRSPRPTATSSTTSSPTPASRSATASTAPAGASAGGRSWRCCAHSPPAPRQRRRPCAPGPPTPRPPPPTRPTPSAGPPSSTAPTTSRSRASTPPPAHSPTTSRRGVDSAERRRLLGFARRAAALAGPDQDRKLAAVTTQVKKLLADGYSPDRVLPLHRHRPLRRRAPRRRPWARRRTRSTSSASPAQLPPAERERRVGELTDLDGAHVLVATDCLSEGVNLQEHFSAVVHYDLCWNPTRHEQREGRVDRYLQRKDVVRAVTLYGEDNGIDGIVLDVLIRRHRAIAKATGVAVPVPGDGQGLIDALAEGLLLRREDSRDQLALDLGLDERTRELEEAWTSAAEQEKVSRTRYAQHTIKPEEVAAEVDEIHAALGTARRPRDLPHRHPARPRLDRHTRRDGLQRRHRHPAARPAHGAAGRPARPAVGSDADPPADRGEAVVARTDPTVQTIARYVLESALDDTVPARERPARRAGVMRTNAVQTRTTLLLVRFRFQLDLPTADGVQQRVAEDARVLAFEGSATPGHLAPRRASRTTARRPRRPPTSSRESPTTPWARRSTGSRALTPHLDGVADEHADRLLGAHRRARTGAGRHPARTRRHRPAAGRRPERPAPPSRPWRCSMSSGLTSVRVAGALMPGDVLAAVLAGDLDGLTGSAYHLGSENPREAAARVWTHLLGVYRRFRDDLAKLPDDDPAVGLTRERWLTLLLSDLGYGRVPPTPAGGLVVGDKSVPGQPPLGCHARCTCSAGECPSTSAHPGVAGAARAPHAMVQELLNRTDDYLWAIVSNGRVLRLLRDSTTLTGQAYVEFDLEAMFDGDLFAEFALLYLLCHQSRVEVPADGQPSDCWLERWRVDRGEPGRARPDAAARRRRTARSRRSAPASSSTPPTPTFAIAWTHGEIRLERRARGAAPAGLPPALLGRRRGPRRAAEPGGNPGRTTPLRRALLLAHGFAASPCAATAAATTTSGKAPPSSSTRWATRTASLGWDCPASAASSRQQRPTSSPAAACRTPLCSPRSARWRWSSPRASRSASSTSRTSVPRNSAPSTSPCSSSCPATTPPPTRSPSRRWPATTARPPAATTPRPSWSSSSSTPPSTRSSTTPRRARTPRKRPKRRCSALRVCDPSVGSAHFLVAAARRIATRVATVRTGEVDPTPTAYSDALHDVVARCVYGVDINPMAADLAKVSLWLTAMSPGRPLSFLDHHIKVGNALLGTTPALLHAGIPDDRLRRAHRRRQGGRHVLEEAQRRRAAHAAKVTSSTTPASTSTPPSCARPPSRSPTARRGRAPSTTSPGPPSATPTSRPTRTRSGPAASPTPGAPRSSARRPPTPSRSPHAHPDRPRRRHRPDEVVAAVDEIAARHRLFHWHLEFPEVFRVPDDGPADGPYGWTGGFDAVLRQPAVGDASSCRSRSSSPPATRRSPRPRTPPPARRPSPPSPTPTRRCCDEFNAARRAQRGGEPVPARQRPLPALRRRRRQHLQRLRRALPRHARAARAQRHHHPDRPGDRRDHRRVLRRHAARRSGWPRSTTSRTRRRSSTGVHHAVPLRGVVDDRRRACRRTCGWPSYIRHVADVPARRFALAADEVLLLNPNTGTLPVFRTRRDAEITLACYRRHPVLIRDGGAQPLGAPLRDALQHGQRQRAASGPPTTSTS